VLCQMSQPFSRGRSVAGVVSCLRPDGVSHFRPEASKAILAFHFQ